MKKKSIIALLCAMLSVVMLAVPVFAQTYDNPFVDVKEGDYFYIPILWAYENKITAGMDATHFAPNKACTRAQVVTFLWRARGEQEPTTTDNPFVDVSETDYFYKAVLWAVENGITAGTSSNTFSPNKKCTRGQVATFLWRLDGCKEPATDANPFLDVTKQDFFYKAVLWAVENGITAGTSETTFSPQANSSRGQIVTFLYRTLVGPETT